MNDGIPGGQYEDSYQRLERLSQARLEAFRELKAAVAVQEKDVESASESYGNVELIQGIIDVANEQEVALDKEVEVLREKYKVALSGKDTTDPEAERFLFDQIMYMNRELLGIRERLINLYNQLDKLYEEHRAISGDVHGSTVVFRILFKKYIDISKQLENLE
jgi:hypothetical protein